MSTNYGYMLEEHNGSEQNATQFQIERMMAKYRTMLPVRVMKVYASDGKTTATRGAVAGAGFVDVQPVVSQVDGQGQKQDHGTVYHVPYTRMYGGNAALIMDPVVGDIGFIMCADRDISAFKDQITQGTQTNVLPGSLRRFDMADSLYMGGVKNNAPKQYDSYSNTGITKQDVNGNTHAMSPSGINHTAAVGNHNMNAPAGNSNITAQTNINGTAGNAINFSAPNMAVNNNSGGNGTGSAVAIAGLIAATGINIQVFASSGTYTPTTGMMFCIIEMVGGGGAGGGVVGNASVTQGAGGGGSGGYSRAIATAAQIGASQTVTIGAGGTGVAGGSGNGGGTTSVGSLVTANGGAGGNVNNASSGQGQGGAGASVGGGSLTGVRLTGNPGGQGTPGFTTESANIGAVAVGGIGANSVFGGGGASILSGSPNPSNGNGAVGNGGGGGGAASAQSSGTGSETGGGGFNGLVIITEFLHS